MEILLRVIYEDTYLKVTLIKYKSESLFIRDFLKYSQNSQTFQTLQTSQLSNSFNSQTLKLIQHTFKFLPSTSNQSKSSTSNSHLVNFLFL